MSGLGINPSPISGEKKSRTADVTVKVINVKYQKELNLVIVRGSSIGDFSSNKYESLINDIEMHFRRKNALHLYFNYDFLDSSALAYLAGIILTLNEYHGKGKTVKVFWSCLSMADNMEDEGDKLKSLCKFEFHS